MKSIIVIILFVVGAVLTIGLSAQAYQDPPKDHKCVDVCNSKYTPQFLACHAVVQCEAFVEYQTGFCIHQCPDAKK